MGFGDSFKEAVERLLADEQRAAQLAKAMGHVQKGKKVFDQGQEELLRAFQCAPKSDYKAVGKQVAALKRRVRELDEKLDAATKHKR